MTGLPVSGRTSERSKRGHRKNDLTKIGRREERKATEKTNIHI
jgi:hypothetical protein